MHIGAYKPPQTLRKNIGVTKISQIVAFSNVQFFLYINHI